MKVEMSLAWKTLDDDEHREVWDRFGERYEFSPSIDPNHISIAEPSPSVTYNISQDFDSEEKRTDLEGKVLAGLRSQTSPAERIYVLDWQHLCYWLYPHMSFDDWFIPALPNGDYYIFLAEDFRFGIFGHPWEWTSCVWGKGLLAFFESNRPELWDSKRRERS